MVGTQTLRVAAPRSRPVPNIGGSIEDHPFGDRGDHVGRRFGGRHRRRQEPRSRVDPAERRSSDSPTCHSRRKGVVSGVVARGMAEYARQGHRRRLRAIECDSTVSISPSREAASRCGPPATTSGSRWSAAGYGSALAPVANALPLASANRVEYVRGSLTEWYVNGPIGVEQGFTLTSAPADIGGRPLDARAGRRRQLPARAGRWRPRDQPAR